MSDEKKVEAVNNHVLTAEQLKAIRTALDKTRAEFAGMLGYKTGVTIYLKENNKTPISMRDTMALQPYMHLITPVNEDAKNEIPKGGWRAEDNGA